MRAQPKAGGALTGPPARRPAVSATSSAPVATATAPLTPGVRGNNSRAAAPPHQAPLTPGSGCSKLYTDTHEEDDVGATRKPPPLKEVVEQHFSDDNLKQDRFLHELICDSDDGWVDVDTVLMFKNVKALRARRNDVFSALEGSKMLEIWKDEDDGSGAVRRPPSKRMPKLDMVSGARSVAGGGGAPHPPAQPPASSPASAKKVVNSRVSETKVADAKPVSSDASGRRGPPLFPGRLTGTIVDFDEEAGSASISCPQTFALFQRHVDIDWRELGRSGACIKMGSPVSFLVELSPDGAPMARDLQLSAAAPEFGSSDEDGDLEDREPPTKRARSNGVSKAQPAKRGKQAKEGDRCSGFVKSFHDGIGFGFISCAAAHATFGRDVVIGRADFKNMSVGDSVCFTLLVDPEMGTPKASKVVLGGNPGEDMEEEDEAEDECQAPPSKPAIAPKAKAKRVNLPAGATALVGKRFTGKIKSFNASAGAGMVLCSKTSAVINRDITVGEGELAGFDTGDTISFEFCIDEESGLPMGVELEAAEEEPPPAKPPKSVAKKTTVKKENAAIKQEDYDWGAEEWDESAW